MSKQVEFFFDVGSPTTYLAYTQLPEIAARAGAEIVWKPMLLGGVFKATGNQTPAAIPAKAVHMNADLTRFAARYGVPLAFNSHFPINTLQLMRGAVAEQQEGRLLPYLELVFDAMWVHPRNLNDPAELARLLKEGGHDPETFAARLQDEAVKEGLKKNTEEAIQRGAFGAPTFFVGEEMFFGQDRLDFVEEALKAA
jgi:2-hydroxychromene-2-carboxylate isomerase